MIELFSRKRIDILIDEPLTGWLIEVAEKAGIAHYSLIAMHSGRGRGGAWRDDDGYGTVGKMMFIAVTSAEKLSSLLDDIAPHIEAYGLVITAYDVDVVRGERF